MDHRPTVWPRRGAVILASCIALVCAACAAPSTAVVSSTVTPIGDTPGPTPPPSMTTASQSPTLITTPTFIPRTATAEPSATPPVKNTAAPMALQNIQPLRQAEVVDRPMRDIRAVTDGRRKYRIAAWSPHSMYAAATPQDGPGIDLIDLETGAITPLVIDIYVLEPRWTPDGKLIVHRVDKGRDTLTLYDPKTGWDEPPLVAGPPLSAPDAKDTLAVFNRGDSVVVCHAPCTTEDRTLAGGALVTALAPGSEAMLAWNPLVKNLEDVQTSIISLASADTMPEMVSLPGEGLWLPRWSPDSTRLALTSIEGRLVVVDIANGARRDLGPGDAPAWSPDGTTIAYAGTSAGLDYTTRDIHIVRADGTGERQRLTDANDEQFYVSPSWSPDGRQILFVELDSGQLFVGTAPGH